MNDFGDYLSKEKSDGRRQIDRQTETEYFWGQKSSKKDKSTQSSNALDYNTSLAYTE